MTKLKLKELSPRQRAFIRNKQRKAKKMDTNPKYLTYEDNLGNETFLIFPYFIKHDTIGFHIGYDKIISAGFVNDWFECYGKSIGLNKKSRVEKDTALLRKLFNYKE